MVDGLRVVTVQLIFDCPEVTQEIVQITPVLDGDYLDAGISSGSGSVM